MKMTKLTTIAALAMGLALIGTAQDAPRAPRQGGPGGQFGQGPGGMRRMGPPMGPGLLMHPDVQKELKLTNDQVDEIRELLPRGPMNGGGRQGGPGGQGGPPPQGRGGEGFGGPGGPPPQGEPGAAGPGIAHSAFAG